MCEFTGGDLRIRILEIRTLLLLDVFCIASRVLNNGTNGELSKAESYSITKISGLSKRKQEWSKVFNIWSIVLWQLEDPPLFQSSETRI